MGTPLSLDYFIRQYLRTGYIVLFNLALNNWIREEKTRLEYMTDKIYYLEPRGAYTSAEEATDIKTISFSQFFFTHIHLNNNIKKNQSCSCLHRSRNKGVWGWHVSSPYLVYECKTKLKYSLDLRNSLGSSYCMF